MRFGLLGFPGLRWKKISAGHCLVTARCVPFELFCVRMRPLAPVGHGPTHNVNIPMESHPAAHDGSPAPRSPASDDAPSRSRGQRVIKVYVTSTEKARIKARAQRVNRSMSEYLRAAALDRGPGELLEVLLRVDLRVLNTQLRDLLDRMATSGRASPSECREGRAAEIRGVCRTIREALQAIAELQDVQLNRAYRPERRPDTEVPVGVDRGEAEATKSDPR